MSQDNVQVECYRKQEAGAWQKQVYGLGDIVEIVSVDFSCPIERIYNKVLGITV